MNWEAALVSGAVLIALAWAVKAAFERFQQPSMPPCPNCQRSSRVVPVVYGEPTRKMMHRARRGRISLGGFRLHEDDPDVHCLQCEFRWLSSAPPTHTPSNPAAG